MPELFEKTCEMYVLGKISYHKPKIIIPAIHCYTSTAKEVGFDFQSEEEFCHSLFVGIKTKCIGINVIKFIEVVLEIIMFVLWML